MLKGFNWSFQQSLKISFAKLFSTSTHIHIEKKQEGRKVGWMKGWGQGREDRRKKIVEVEGRVRRPKGRVLRIFHK